jgi:hypothetical protein
MSSRSCGAGCLSPNVKDVLAVHGVMPDVGSWNGPTLLHELVQFASAPLLRRFISTSSQGLVLKCALDNGKRVSSRRDLQRIWKRTEPRQKKELPSRDEDHCQEPGWCASRDDSRKVGAFGGDVLI